MKVYISADIEGITGVSTWREADDIGSAKAREQMTREVAAACEGALEVGAREVLVKDAHGEGKNLIHDMLPKQVKLLSGWRGHPFNMIEGLEADHTGVIFIGYHSDGLTDTSPLAHTFCHKTIRGIWLNDEPASEFTIYSYAAHSIGVPVIAVSGDRGLINQVESFDPTIPAVITQEGIGSGVISQHPIASCEQIKQAVIKGLSQVGKYKIGMPEAFTLKVAFTQHQDAYKYSFYPGAERADAFTIVYKSDNYMDILTFLLFI